MRLLAFCLLSALFHSCATIHSYTFDFTDPVPTDATFFLIQEEGAKILKTQMATELRRAGFKVVGNNEIRRTLNGPEIQINTSDTTYTEQASYPFFEEIFDRPEFDYVLRYRAGRWGNNQQAMGNFSATLINAKSGVIIGTYTHRGYVLGPDVPSFLNTVAAAIRDGRIEEYVNPRRVNGYQTYPQKTSTEE